MTKSEDDFIKILQEVILENPDTSINMDVARQLYNGGFVDGLDSGQNIERQRILGIFRHRSRYGGLSPRVYEGLKRRIEKNDNTKKM